MVVVVVATFQLPDLASGELAGEELRGQRRPRRIG